MHDDNNYDQPSNNNYNNIFINELQQSVIDCDTPIRDDEPVLGDANNLNIINNIHHHQINSTVISSTQQQTANNNNNNNNCSNRKILISERILKTKPIWYLPYLDESSIKDRLRNKQAGVSLSFKYKFFIFILYTSYIF